MASYTMQAIAKAIAHCVGYLAGTIAALTVL